MDGAGKEISIFVGNVSNEGNKAISDISNNTNKGLQDIANTLNKANSDTAKTIDQAGNDVKENIAKSGRDVDEAGQAIGHYVEHSTQSLGKSVDRAANRIREGKFVDAIWHASLDPLQDGQANLALAAQESSVLRTVGQVAAIAYGGPQGAAAYAAWLTYNQTGNADLALRVGLLTGITAQAFASAGQISTTEDYGLIRKTLVTASIGGLAVAASGGTEKQVKEGFLAAGAMVLVQDHYQRMTTHKLDRDSMKASKDMGSFCIRANKIACTPVPKEAIAQQDPDGPVTAVYRNKLDRRVPSVGVEGNTTVIGDNSQLMKLVSKVPGTQGMSVLHDNWVDRAHLDVMNAPTIIPAVVVYYTGTGAPFYDHLRKTAIEQAIERQEKSDRGKALDAPSSKLTYVAPVNTSTKMKEDSLEPDQTAVVMSYTCGTGDFVIQMVVEQPKDTRNYACRVLYNKSSSFSESKKVLWRAQHERAYCATKAKSITKRYIKNGWICMKLPSTRKSGS